MCQESREPASFLSAEALEFGFEVHACLSSPCVHSACPGAAKQSHGLFGVQGFQVLGFRVQGLGFRV